MLRWTRVKRSSSMGDEKMKKFGVGTKAYIDSFNGLVPCKVVGINVIKPYMNELRKYGTAVTVKVTRTGHGYKAGELVEFSGDRVPPRECVRRRRTNVTICMDYQYVEGEA